MAEESRKPARRRDVDIGKTMSDGFEIPADKPDPQYWRERAKRTRADAERITNIRTKRMMLGAAAGYERLAERTEQPFA
jgi:hypothetical protein